MSIFPERPKKSAVTPAKAGVQIEASGRSALDPGLRRDDGGETVRASSKPHRFDKFAKKLAANMLTAIRTSLSVLSSPGKDRWPAHRLLEYLKGAEALARDMLREIAAKLVITPQPLRERRNVSVAVPCEKSAERAPCFRLGVNAKTRGADEKTGVPLSRFAGEGSGVRAQIVYPGARPLDPPPAAGRGKRAVDESALSRLTALEDVLQHPGKHAARMARALYRAENGSGQRLTAQSPDDVLIDSVNGMIAAHEASDAETFAGLASALPAYDSS